MGWKDKIKILILGYRATSASYIDHLRKIGVRIGNDVVLFRPMNTTIDTQNPHLLRIRNPARKIMSLEDYYEKRKKKQLAEAVNYLQCYKECFGENPPMDKLDEYFYLFFDPKNEEQRKIFDFKLNLMGNYDEALQAAIGGAIFKSYKEFIDYCELINNGWKNNE